MNSFAKQIKRDKNLFLLLLNMDQNEHKQPTTQKMSLSNEIPRKNVKIGPLRPKATCDPFGSKNFFYLNFMPTLWHYFFYET